jgi:hypothetical protein
MPRKVTQETKERPYYVDADGTLNVSKIFKHQPIQLELLREVSRNGGLYVQTAAKQCLSVGGIRSGKTTGALMFFVMYYCMKFDKCDILVLRRTFKELESGAIADFKTFMPKELYDYDQTKHVATLHNGSRVVFGHCQNNKERDIEQYLGQAYAGILVDECGQFSPDAWMMLYARNLVNASCQPDEHGNLPIPCIWGCTNPLGPFYEFYRTVFVQKEPWMAPEEAKKDLKGSWWVSESGQWREIYDPRDYAYQRSTVMDNPKMLERQPDIISKLNSMPKAKRDKMLFGLDGKFEGQYFDVWDEQYHVVNLRDDPEAIIWQSWQPVWVGQDWGMGHANASYFFTKALVKDVVGSDYKLRTVCFQEVVTTGGKTYKELASILSMKAKLPTGAPVKIRSIYFSHEKFARQMDTHSPADDYSRALRELGLPSVTRGTQDRIGSASLVYNMLKNGELVVLDYCKDIINTFPSLMRDPDKMDDVLKTDARGDDCYDGFRLGIYGQLAARKRPSEDAIFDHASTLDPLAKHFYLQKQLANRTRDDAAFTQSKQPQWQTKMDQL